MPNWKKVITSGSNAILNDITASRLTLESSGSTIFDVVGSQGQLFSITDSLSGSLFAVSDISGLPILEVFSDDTVKIGSFNNEAIIVSGSNATITGSFTGSFTGDGSNLTGISSDPFPYTGSAIITNNLDVGGSGSFGNNQLLIGTNNSAAGFNSTFEFQNGPSTYSSQLVLRPTGNPGGYNANYWGAIRSNPSNESGLTILAGNYTTNILFGRGAPSTANPQAFAKLNDDGLRLQSSYIQNIASAEEKLHVVGNAKITGFVTASGNLITEANITASGHVSDLHILRRRL